MTSRDGTLLLCISLTFLSSLLFSLHGVGVSNVPAFLIYIIVISILVSGRNFKRLRSSRVSGLALFFFVTASLSVVLQNAINGSLADNNGVDAFEFAVNNLIVNFTYFVFGWLAVLPRNNNLGAYVYVPLGMLSAALIPFGLGVIDYQAISEAAGKDVNHLVVAPNALALMFISLAYSRGLVRLSVYFFCVILLFMVGSRTALFFGSFVALMVLFFVGQARVRLLSILGSSFIVFLLIVFQGYFEKDVAERMFFGDGFSDDLSGASRLIQFEAGFQALSEQVMIGDMNFVVRYFGGVGFYMHNILAFWQEFGLTVFLIVCLLLTLLCLEIRRDLNFLKASQSSIVEYRVYLGAYAVIATLFSMSYTFKMLWFAVGMYCVDFRRK